MFYKCKYDIYSNMHIRNTVMFQYNNKCNINIFASILHFVCLPICQQGSEFKYSENKNNETFIFSLLIDDHILHPNFRIRYKSLKIYL